MPPAFEVTTDRRQHTSPDELEDKVALIDFWATWCVPCGEALPSYNNASRKSCEGKLKKLSAQAGEMQQVAGFLIGCQAMIAYRCENGLGQPPFDNRLCSSNVVSTSKM